MTESDIRWSGCFNALRWDKKRQAYVNCKRWVDYKCGKCELYLAYRAGIRDACMCMRKSIADAGSYEGQVLHPLESEIARSGAKKEE